MVVYLVWRGQTTNPGRMLSLVNQGVVIWGRNFAVMAKGFFPALGGEETKRVILDATKTTVMLMFIIANALLFAHTLAAERIPQTITEWMLGAGFNWFTFLIAVNILLLLGGQFMEPSGLLLIVAPWCSQSRWSWYRSDSLRDHHGCEHGDWDDYAADRSQSLRHLWDHRHESRSSREGGCAIVAVLFVFLILVTYIPWLSTWLPTFGDGAGDHCKIRSLTGVGMIYHAGSFLMR